MKFVLESRCILLHFKTRVNYSVYLYVTDAAAVALRIRDERECLFQFHSLPFSMVHCHSHSQSQV